MSSNQTKRPKVMQYFSTLAGPLQKIGTDKQVRFTNMDAQDKWVYRNWTRVLAYGTLLLVLAFAFVLFRPDHWIVVQQPDSATHAFNLFMLICLALLQIFLITGTFAATRATVKAKNPVPVQPATKLRIAFVTTRAPGEPVSMAEHTLSAMKRIRYARGKVDVWLLDETNDPELIRICKKLGVNHFSRKGVEEWNTGKPQGSLRRFAAWLLKPTRQSKDATGYVKPNATFAAKTKHGNFNSWEQYLLNNHFAYDVIAGVDTDHVPEPNYLQRMLGYFRDPDVAFVVGPQVYGNYGPGLKGLVSRWSESQASFFQSTIQRAGNATASPMFVGTNYAIRTRVLSQIGGFQPCITEDMATGLVVHSSKNPDTGKQWKSVYTPDVLAVGEGPDFWGPYFSQQWRWAAGSYDTWKRIVWKVLFKLPLRMRLHYLLMLTFYPMTALTWLLGVASSMTYMLTGATAILAPWNQFVALYLMSLVMQLSLYFWNRRYNVSPHEPAGTYGVSGMALTTFTAPVYLSALGGILLGKKPNFVVTTKGSSKNPDSWQTFNLHLKWGLLLLAGIVYGVLNGNAHPAMMLWVLMQLAVCIIPTVLGMTAVYQERWRDRATEKRNKKSVIIAEGPQNAY